MEKNSVHIKKALENSFLNGNWHGRIPFT